MKRLIAGLSVLYLASLATAQERYPNNDSAQRFPWWSEPAAVFTGTDNTFEGSIAVRPSDNTVTVAYGRQSGVNEYVNIATDEWAKRKGNGFSDPTQMPNQTLSYNSSPDIAYDSEDNLHVVWVQGNGNPSGASVKYQKYTAATDSWDDLMSVVDGSVTISWKHPRLAIDSAGTIHVVMLEETTFTSKIYYSSKEDIETEFSDPPDLISNGPVDLFTPPEIAIGEETLPVPHVVWVEYDTVPEPDKPHPFHSVLYSSGSWQTTDLTIGFEGRAVSVDCDSVDGSAHVAYTAGVDGFDVVEYRKRPAGQASEFGDEESVSTGTDTDLPRIRIDSRGQPHIVWIGPAGYAYAEKVEATTWSRQEPIDVVQESGFEVNFLDVTLNSNDRISVVHSSESPYAMWYLTTYEPNLGTQDEFVHVPVAPGARANVATGGVDFTLPILSTRGAGLAANVSLIYNSLEGHAGALSPGWTHNYQIHVTDHHTRDIAASKDRFTLTLGSGRKIVFEHNATHNEILAQKEFGYFGKLERQTTMRDSSSVEYLLTTKHNAEYGFNADGKLIRILDTNDNAMTFQYLQQPQDPLLEKITDSMGRETLFEYEQNTNRLKKITDPLTRTYSLAYHTDADKKHLKSVTLDDAPVPTKWEFDYYTDTAPDPDFRRTNLLSEITTPRAFAWKLKYYEDNRVRGSQDPPLSIRESLDEDGTTQIAQHKDRIFTYTDPEDPDATANRPSIQYKNRREKDTVIEVEYARSLVRLIKDPNQQELEREFDGTYRNLKKVIDREDNETEYSYTHEPGQGSQELPTYVMDNIREVKEPSANAGTGGVTATIATGRYTYTSNANGNAFRVKTFKDALGNTTTYDYDSDAKGNLTQIMHPFVGQKQAIEVFGRDSMGRVTSYTAPEVTTKTGPQSGQTTYVYGDIDTGLPTEIHLPGRGNPLTMTYDKMGNLADRIQPGGGITKTVYDNLYRVSTVTLPDADEGAVISYVYNEDSQITEINGPVQARTVNVYDEHGRLVTVSRDASAGLAAVTDYHYDSEGNVRKTIDPNRRTYTATYDALDQTVQTVVPGGHSPDIKTTRNYGGNGWVTSVVVSEGPTAVTTTLARTARGQVKSRISPVSTIYDDIEYYEDGLTESSVRMDDSLPVGQREKYGTAWSFDEMRRLSAVTQVTSFGATMSGPTTTLTRDCLGTVTRITDPMGRKVSMTYDIGGRPVLVKDDDGNEVSATEYTDDDQEKTVKVADAETNQLIVARTNEYNARNELKKTTDFFGDSATYTYDSRGNVKMVRLPGNCTIAYDYDLLNRVTRQVRHPGSFDQISNQYRYDANGNLVQITDPLNRIYRIDYDGANRVIGRTYPSARFGGIYESWGYDARGNLKRHTDRNGKEVVFDYDTLDRPILETHRIGGATGVKMAEIERQYDGASNVVLVHDKVSRVKVSYTLDDYVTPAYDNLNRLMQVNIFLEDTIYWKAVKYQKEDQSAGYDDSGNLVRMVDPEGHAFDYAYDNNSRLTTVTRTPNGGSATIIAAHFYSVSGHLQSSVLEGGAAHYFDYDEKGRALTLRTLKPDGTLASHFNYTYDERGRRERARLDHLGTEVNYTYDCHDRLTGEVWEANSTPPSPNCQNKDFTGPQGNFTPLTTLTGVCGSRNTPGTFPAVEKYEAEWTYDAAGNRTLERQRENLGSWVETNYAYDAQNHLLWEATGDDVTDYTYDRDGSLLTRTRDGVQERWTYNYRNIATTYQEGPVSGPTKSHVYQCDPLGNRLSKKNALTGAEEWFAYDGPNVTAEYTRTGGTGSYDLRRTYVNGGSIDSKLARIDVSGSVETMTYYAGDALRSVHELLATDGTVKQRQLSNAWGEDLPGFESLLAGGFEEDLHGLHQRRKDKESGLMYFRNRLYDPTTGRFTQTDPIRTNRPREHYTFTRNDPHKYKDPMGTDVRIRGAHKSWMQVYRHRLMVFGALQHRFRNLPLQMDITTGRVSIDSTVDFDIETLTSEENDLRFAIIDSTRDYFPDASSFIGDIKKGRTASETNRLEYQRRAQAAARMREELGAIPRVLPPTENPMNQVFVELIPGKGSYDAAFGTDLPWWHRTLSGASDIPFLKPIKLFKWLRGAWAGRAARASFGMADDAAGIIIKSGSVEAGEIAGFRLFRLARTPRHHVFPQKHKKWFADRGFDIDKYSVPLDDGVHSALHSMGWTDDIMERLRTAEKIKGDVLSHDEILNIGKQQLSDYRVFDYEFLPFEDP